MKGFVARILESSFIDGPGHRAVVFLQGCDMRCLYCHNPETRALCNACGECIRVCPAEALDLEKGRLTWDRTRCMKCDACILACRHDSSPRVEALEAEELAARIIPLLPFIDGVTFSGGECGLQSAFLIEVARVMKSGDGQALSLLADTNGGLPSDGFLPLLEAFDGFIFDLKATREETHRKLTGLDLGPVLKNLKAAARAGKLVEVRTVLVEDWNDSDEDLKLAAEIFSALEGRANYRLIPFRPQGVRGCFSSKPAYPLDKYEAILRDMRGLLGARVVSPIF